MCAYVGVTHTNNQDKTFRSFRWKAPAAGTGPVQIWCSFVKVKLEFWVHVKSEVFEENGGTTTPPPHVTTSPHEKVSVLSTIRAGPRVHPGPALIPVHSMNIDQQQKKF